MGSRFGDTAANVGMLTLLNSNPSTKDLPTPVKTFAASSAASAWRVVLMPLDTIKTIMQVEGKEGIPKLRAKIKTGGPRVMWHGAMGAMGATFAGHYPWFATYNTIDELWQPVPKETLPKLGRAACMGFCASVVSDTVSNSIRVMKTYRQTSEVPISYREVALMQGPLSRFGDTAANVGMLTLLNSNPSTKDLPTPDKAFAASSAASAWRVVLMPLDTIKTIMQVEGKEGIPKLRAKIKTGGPRVMWHGAMGAMGATFAGHYPWFATYNTIDELWQPVPKETLPKLGRAACMGFCASVVSD